MLHKARHFQIASEFEVRTATADASTMASLAALSPNSKQKMAKQQLSQRIERCWNQELNWSLFPTKLKEVIMYRW